MLPRWVYGALVWMLCVPTATLKGQVYETQCPSVLSPRFPGYTYIEFNGYYFDTEWIAVSSARPLSSLEWYRPPLSSPAPLSRDGSVRWHEAAVQVHCWFYRDSFIFARHLDPVAFKGRTLAAEDCEEGASPEEDWEALYHEEYDPYSPVHPGCGAGWGMGGGEEGGIIDGTSGGGGAACGGGTVLYYDHVCIDAWIEEIGEWVTIWCGVAAFCG